jgi:lipopolysaccharide transport system permease protein
MIEKVYFPRLLLPLAAVGAYLLDFGIALVVLVLIMLFLGVAPGPAALWIVPLTFVCVAAALGVGIWLSAINVRYRDVRHAIPFLVQVGLFASPVAYSADLVPAEWQTIYHLNPMAGVIEGFRWALLARTPAPVDAIAISVIVTAFLLISGLAYFRRVERTFADVI